MIYFDWIYGSVAEVITGGQVCRMSVPLTELVLEPSFKL